MFVHGCQLVLMVDVILSMGNLYFPYLSCWSQNHKLDNVLTQFKCYSVRYMPACFLLLVIM